VQNKSEATIMIGNGENSEHSTEKPMINQQIAISNKENINLNINSPIFINFEENIDCNQNQLNIFTDKENNSHNKNSTPKFTHIPTKSPNPTPSPLPSNLPIPQSPFTFCKPPLGQSNHPTLSKVHLQLKPQSHSRSN
jgi:hypothetical protein